jgi:hypothetical protein
MPVVMTVHVSIQAVPMQPHATTMKVQAAMTAHAYMAAVPSPVLATMT